MTVLLRMLAGKTLTCLFTAGFCPFLNLQIISKRTMGVVKNEIYMVTKKQTDGRRQSSDSLPQPSQHMYVRDAYIYLSQTADKV